VRLTMGGEPTFVSIDDMDGAQWNTGALGEEKQQLSESLHQGGCASSGRPAGCCTTARGNGTRANPCPAGPWAATGARDGKPVWRDDRWIADVSNDYGFGIAEAKRFIDPGRHAGVSRRFIRESYEDILYYLHKEQRLPVNVDPTDPKLDDPEARARMARTFQRGLGAVVGYVLPLQHGSWKSGPWPLRGGHMFLLPGDSPAGLRLPLESLPWVSKSRFSLSTIPWIPWPTGAAARSARRPAGPAGRPAAGWATACAPSPALREPEPVAGESAAWVVRTALCVQPREGRLYVFMPPIISLEGYLELVAAVEATAATNRLARGDRRLHAALRPAAQQPQNHARPRGHRGQHPAHAQLAGTGRLHHRPLRNRPPDPPGHGKIHARRPPHRHRRRQPHRHRRRHPGGQPLSAAAGSAAQLRHLLEQPPLLSFLFSGLFIGPTSQQPRIDEARHDSLYELEIAFAELDRQTVPTSPARRGWWTASSATCWWMSPATPTARNSASTSSIRRTVPPDAWGCWSFVAFEMPPHARMSLAQQLLLRVLWPGSGKPPIDRELVRWGTRLHDRFMLPQPLQDDFADVLKS
jgi:uncharacterized protein (DUF2126 family)